MIQHPIYGSMSIDQCLAKLAADMVLEETKREQRVAEENGDLGQGYYEGKDGTSTIDIIEEFELGFCLGNVIKYVLRAGKKAGNSELEDLNKALWYLERYMDIATDEL